jgi:hypothetical protein
LKKNFLTILSIGTWLVAHLHADAQQITRQNHRANVNYDSLRIVLETMHDSDQNIRRILIDSVGLDSPEAPKYLQQMANIDTKNRANLELILEKYGWIEQSKIGEKAAAGIFYIIQHSDIELMEKYFPQMKALAERGEASTVLTAMMEDRLLMWKGKKQIYGTQATTGLRPNNRLAVWPIKDPSKVNELRKKAGFPTTVEENAKGMNADYNPHEMLPPPKN